MKNIFFNLLMILVFYKSHGQERSADNFFMEGARHLFAAEFMEARQLFAKAYKLYELDNSQLKMNECLMAMGTTEFSMGNVDAALIQFKLARNLHLKISPENKEGLQLIQDNIDLCIQERKRARRIKNQDHK